MTSKESGRNYEIYSALSVLGLLVIASLGAFSKKTRDEIWKRDKKKSKESGKGGKLHAAHNPNSHHHDGIFYDDADSGACQCIECHTAQHEAGTSLGKHADEAAVRLLTHNAKRWKK